MLPPAGTPTPSPSPAYHAAALHPAAWGVQRKSRDAFQPESPVQPPAPPSTPQVSLCSVTVLNTSYNTFAWPAAHVSIQSNRCKILTCTVNRMVVPVAAAACNFCGVRYVQKCCFTAALQHSTSWGTAVSQSAKLTLLLKAQASAAPHCSLSACINSSLHEALMMPFGHCSHHATQPKWGQVVSAGDLGGAGAGSKLCSTWQY